MEKYQKLSSHLIICAFCFVLEKILIRVALIPLRDISICFGQHLILLLSSDFGESLKQLPHSSVINGMDVVIRILVLKVINFTGPVWL